MFGFILLLIYIVFRYVQYTIVHALTAENIPRDQVLFDTGSGVTGRRVILP